MRISLWSIDDMKALVLGSAQCKACRNCIFPALNYPPSPILEPMVFFFLAEFAISVLLCIA